MRQKNIKYYCWKQNKCLCTMPEHVDVLALLCGCWWSYFFFHFCVQSGHSPCAILHFLLIIIPNLRIELLYGLAIHVRLFCWTHQIKLAFYSQKAINLMTAFDFLFFLPHLKSRPKFACSSKRIKHRLKGRVRISS